VEPARLSVQFLQQLPVVLAARDGIQDLWTLARLFTLGMDGWPLALTALCWSVLAGREKIWILGPLINLVFAIPAAEFIGISEGTIASCLLWLAVLLVRFRLAQPFGSLAALAATVGCAVAHEAMLPGLLLISWLAASQVKDLRGFPRFVSFLVAVVSVAGALYMGRWIVAPRSTPGSESKIPQSRIENRRHRLVASHAPSTSAQGWSVRIIKYGQPCRSHPTRRQFFRLVRIPCQTEMPFESI